jgi:hypothetical protein
VEHPLDPGERPPDGAAVAHLEPRPLRVEVRDRGVWRALLDPKAQLIPTLGEEVRDV